MKITTKAVFDIATGALLDWEGFEYSGPLELAGGGPSKQQRDAAQSQANLTNQLGATANRQEQFMESQQNKVNPFYTSRMNNGLPYFNQFTDAQSGLTARAFAPARQQLLQRLGTQQGLPSGFRNQALTDLDSQQARAFDDQLQTGLGLNEQAKQLGASGLMGQAQIANPLGYYGGALSGNESIMKAPLAKPGLGGLLGNVFGSFAGAFAKGGM
jgi:hypothetical protein